jgi:hypothetical protein
MAIMCREINQRKKGKKPGQITKIGVDGSEYNDTVYGILTMVYDIQN